MDPNATWKRILELPEEIADCADACMQTFLFLELRDSIAALEEWIANGGFIPSDWDHS